MLVFSTEFEVLITRVSSDWPHFTEWFPYPASCTVLPFLTSYPCVLEETCFDFSEDECLYMPWPISSSFLEPSSSGHPLLTSGLSPGVFGWSLFAHSVQLDYFELRKGRESCWFFPAHQPYCHLYCHACAKGVVCDSFPCHLLFFSHYSIAETTTELFVSFLTLFLFCLSDMISWPPCSSLNSPFMDLIKYSYFFWFPCLIG